MLEQSVEGKDGKAIEVGEEVWTRFRGGKHQGKVKCFDLRSQNQAETRVAIYLEGGSSGQRSE